MSASTAVPSRTPADYRPTPHFVSRKKERRVPGYAIRDAIERGTPERLGDGRIAVTAGHYTVVLNPRTMHVETTYAGSP